MVASGSNGITTNLCVSYWIQGAQEFAFLTVPRCWRWSRYLTLSSTGLGQEILDANQSYLSNFLKNFSIFKNFSIPFIFKNNLFQTLTSRFN